MSEASKPVDVLILGRGLAGGIAALAAVESGAQVRMIAHGESASSWAQGGIIYKNDSDPTSLKQDLFKSGCGLNNPEAVAQVAERGPGLVEKWLFQKLNVPFDAGTDGNPDLCLEAAHNARRIVHVKDHTGASIQDCLDRVLVQNTQIESTDGILVDLLVADRHDARSESVYRQNKICGAYVWNPATQQVEVITAKTVILASGGFSGLYFHSTGPRASTGDGIAAAHRAGARSLHLEFVQFHPTALYIPGEPRRLLTEALRGAGARLLDSKGQRFVDELAPRDVVARAIHERMTSESTRHVVLDLSGIQKLEEEFPSVTALLKSKGFDPRRDPIPVVPAAHYTLGGVWTDSTGATSLSGLYAAGEVACTGLHGANRLASASLLEALVYGDAAGRAAATAARTSEFDFQPRPWIPREGAVDPALVGQDWDHLRQILWNYVGLVRSQHRLQRAERALTELRNEVEWFYKTCGLNESLLRLRHGVLTATLVLYSALRRRESVGTHYLKEGY